MVQTVDGLLLKLNIMDNETYEIFDAKDKSLVFQMQNSGREYYIAVKNAKNVDFNLIDRLIRAICIDTSRSTRVFHHIINKE